MLRFPATALALTWVATVAVAAPPSPRVTLTDAKQVLDALTDKEKGIPAKLLREAEAVVIVPKTIKAGFGVAGQLGHGVAVVKDKVGGWGDIRFIGLGGASVGFQIGVQSTDVVLVFKNRKGLDRILDGKAKLKLGGDVSVAAGPVGRNAAVATDLLLKSEIFSYSRSRGLFAGVSLEGVVLNGNTKRTEEFEKDTDLATRKAADELKMTIAVLAAGAKDELVPVPGAPMVMPPPGPFGLPPALEAPLPVPPPTVPTQPGSVIIPASAVEPVIPAESQVGPLRRLIRRLRGGGE